MDAEEDSWPLRGMHRCPHIHVAVSQSGRRIFTSQFLSLDAKALQTILVDFTPLPGSKIGELNANVDIVLGRTHNELQPTSKDSLKGTGKRRR